MPAMSTATSADRRLTAYWLFTCCALVFLMVMIGGITRLTHSGLSIVEWQPVAGVLPPMGEAQWEELFTKYKATPEYRERSGIHGVAAHLLPWKHCAIDQPHACTRPRQDGRGDAASGPSADNQHIVHQSETGNWVIE